MFLSAVLQSRGPGPEVPGRVGVRPRTEEVWVTEKTREVSGDPLGNISFDIES